MAPFYFPVKNARNERPLSCFPVEDFTFEIRIPKNLSIDQVLETCHKECIKVEDEYDLFILPHVIYEQ